MKVSGSHDRALAKDGFVPSGFVTDKLSFEQVFDGFVFNLMFHLFCNIDCVDNERHKFLNCE